MNRSFLWIVILGAVLMVGGAGYLLLNQDTTGTNREAMSEESAAPPTAVEERPAEPETPSDALQSETASDEDAPKPASVNRKNFESEDDTSDTVDGVTIEVEPEEE